MSVGNFCTKKASVADIPEDELEHLIKIRKFHLFCLTRWLRNRLTNFQLTEQRLFSLVLIRFFLNLDIPNRTVQLLFCYNAPHRASLKRPQISLRATSFEQKSRNSASETHYNKKFLTVLPGFFRKIANEHELYENLDDGVLSIHHGTTNDQTLQLTKQSLQFFKHFLSTVLAKKSQYLKQFLHPCCKVQQTISLHTRQLRSPLHMTE